MKDEDGKVSTVRYEAVNAMLLNEFLKEHRNVAEQQSTIAELKTTVAQQQIAAQHVDFADGFRFSGQEPVNRGGKATGRGAFEVQCAQAIRAAYYLDLAARDCILADGAGFFLLVRARAR